jgi:hypothetical protein
MSLETLFATMTSKLNWTVLEKPVVFSQQTPGWWCNVKLKNTSYTKACLNTGTVAWCRSDLAKHVLQTWWNSATDSYERSSNPLEIEFRTEWPWEQERAMALYHNFQDHNNTQGGGNVSDFIQIASQPGEFMMSHSFAANNSEWCLMRQGADKCFITHYTGNGHEKDTLADLANNKAPTLSNDIHVHVNFL